MSTLRETLSLQQNAIEGLREQRKELLDALKAIRDRYEYVGNYYGFNTNVHVDAANEIIAKAEGRS